MAQKAKPKSKTVSTTQPKSGAVVSKKATKPPTHPRTDKILLVLIGLLSISVIALGGILFQISQVKSAATTPADTQAEVLQEKLGRLMMINHDEKPTIATIVDLKKLQTDNPEFYKNAQVGDKLFVYTDRAILYSEKNDIIVNVSPIAKNESTNGLVPQVAGTKTKSPDTSK